MLVNVNNYTHTEMMLSPVRDVLIRSRVSCVRVTHCAVQPHPSSSIVTHSDISTVL